MKEDSDQKERCNKKAEGKFGFLRTVSQIQRAKKPKNALYINRIYFARQSWPGKQLPGIAIPGFKKTLEHTKVQCLSESPWPRKKINLFLHIQQFLNKGRFINIIISLFNNLSKAVNADWQRSKPHKNTHILSGILCYFIISASSSLCKSHSLYWRPLARRTHQKNASGTLMSKRILFRSYNRPP